MESRASHWENIYNTKTADQVSWTQKGPTTSLRLIKEKARSKSDAIIDVGGGDSLLVDHLLNEGFTNITVLDISQKALERAQERLGDKADLVNWIHADISLFKPDTSYDIWHDRAVFHFLTNTKDQQQYKQLLDEHLSRHLILATFSVDGPIKCSGLEIVQYNQDMLQEQFQDILNLDSHFREDHLTPFNSIQNFQFAVFSK